MTLTTSFVDSATSVIPASNVKVENLSPGKTVFTPCGIDVTSYVTAVNDQWNEKEFHWFPQIQLSHVRCRR